VEGNYRIEGQAFVYAHRDTGRISTIFGCPTQRLAKLASKVSNMFG
jgi:hypothetical protein